MEIDRNIYYCKCGDMLESCYDGNFLHFNQGRYGTKSEKTGCMSPRVEKVIKR